MRASNPNPKIAAAYEGLTLIRNGRPGWTGKVRELPERLSEPFRWRAPCRIFVNSMSDLFHEEVSFEFQRRVFDVMVRADWHTYQVLTKRPAAMKRFAVWWFMQHTDPIPAHVWLGTSVEDQQRADERVPLLVDTPAQVRFLSVEPLLEPIFLPTLAGLHWVIVGGESGPGARPCKLEWIGNVVEQCKAAGVRVFCKQVGSVLARELGSTDSKGGRLEDWPPEIQVREYPDA